MSRAWPSSRFPGRRAGLVVAAVGLIGTAGCGSADRSVPSPAPPGQLLAQARPIGRGPAFQPPVTGPVLGRCAPELGSRLGVHVEVFAADRVVLIPSGIGTKPPLGFLSGRISSAGCYGRLVTLDPTGLILVRPGTRAVLADLFRSWGERLTSRRVGSFSEPRGGQVRVFVDGHRWRGAPDRVPLGRHGEIVVEVGPYVPPHPSYTFPPGT